MSLNSKHFPPLTGTGHGHDFDADDWAKVKEWEASLTPDQDKALDTLADLWFAVEKGYHEITGEWLQR